MGERAKSRFSAIAPHLRAEPAIQVSAQVVSWGRVEIIDQLYKS